MWQKRTSHQVDGKLGLRRSLHLPHLMGIWFRPKMRVMTSLRVSLRRNGPAVNTCQVPPATQMTPMEGHSRCLHSSQWTARHRTRTALRERTRLTCQHPPLLVQVSIIFSLPSVPATVYLPYLFFILLATMATFLSTSITD